MIAGDPTGLHVMAHLTPCNNACGFCLLSDGRTADIEVKRVVALVERLIDYGSGHGLAVKQWFGNSYNWPMEDFKAVFDLFVRNGLGRPVVQDLRFLMLGGLPPMGEGRARAWLRERREAGCLEVVGTYAGLPEVHYRLCRQSGRFALQASLQRLAAQEGLAARSRIILLASGAAQLPALLGRLRPEGAAGAVEVFLMMHSGLGRSFQDERQTRRQLEAAPEGARSIFGPFAAKWRTESEWAEEILSPKEARPENWLSLRLPPERIEDLERRRPEEIVERLKLATAEAYAALPPMDELLERRCDRESQQLYMGARDVEALLVDRHLADHPEDGLWRGLTRFGW